MVKTYVARDKSSSANTFSARTQDTERVIDKIRKSSFDFSQQSKVWDSYRDNRGTVWVMSYFGKSQEDAEYKLWTTHGTPSTATDAKYIAEDLNKSEAIELFSAIVGQSHATIVASFSKALSLPKEVSMEKTQPSNKLLEAPGLRILPANAVGQKLKTSHPRKNAFTETEVAEDMVNFSKSKGLWKKGKKNIPMKQFEAVKTQLKADIAHDISNTKKFRGEEPDYYGKEEKKKQKHRGGK